MSVYLFHVLSKSKYNDNITDMLKCNPYFSLKDVDFKNSKNLLHSLTFPPYIL